VWFSFLTHAYFGTFLLYCVRNKTNKTMNQTLHDNYAMFIEVYVLQSNCKTKYHAMKDLDMNVFS